MAVKCTNCGGAHPSWDCSKPNKMPSSGSSSKSKDVEEPALRKGHEVSRGAKRKEQHPTPKPKMGRPRTGYIKAEYNRKYMQDKRKADKLGITVKELREKEK